MTKIYLSIVISAWNEEKSIKNGSIDRLLEYLTPQKFTWELILVNDGSTDKTLDLVTQYTKADSRIRVLNNPHMGKAAGIVTGGLTATGEIILFTDMDQSTPISEFEKFKHYFQTGSDIVIGSREGRKGAPLFRKVLAYGMVVLRGIILNLPFKDTQCGFKAFRGQVARQLFSKVESVHQFKPVVGGVVNPGFDVELLYMAKAQGLKISEVGVEWKHVHSERVRFLRDAVAGISELFLVRLRSWFGRYSL